MYSSQGYFIRLNELIENYAPNIKYLLDNDKKFRQAITRPNGDINNLPMVNIDIPLNPLWINEKWLKVLDLPYPETTEELYEVLKAFKDRDPNGNGINDEVPMIINAAGSGAASLGNIISFLAYFGAYLDPITLASVDETGTVIYGPVTNEFRQGLSFLARLFREGLLHNEVFTMNQQQATAIGSGPVEVAGSFITSSPLIIVGNQRHFDYGTVLLTAPNGTKKFPLIDKFSPGRFIITNKNKNPEAAIRWADFLYSEEGGIMTWMGKENETFKINDDGSWDWILPPGEAFGEFRGRVTFQPGGNYTGIIPALWTRINNSHEQHLVKMRDRLLPYCFSINPVIYYSRRDNRRINSLTNDLNLVVTTTIAQAITGFTDLDNQVVWERYVKQLESIGYKELVEIIQRNVDLLD